MSEGNDQDQGKGRLSLRPATRADVGRTVDGGSVRQSFSHGTSHRRAQSPANFLDKGAFRGGELRDPARFTTSAT